MPAKSLNDCGEPYDGSKDNDPVMPYCADDKTKFETCNEEQHLYYKDVPPPDDIRPRKYGLGQGYNCDPMQAGYISNTKNSSPDYIYRYAQGLRAVDEAMLDLFGNIVVRDDLGKIHKVPIVPGGQEAAIAVVLRSNVRKDNTLVVDRIRLPIMALSDESFSLDLNNYVYHKAINYKRRASDGKPGYTVNERWERDTILGFARGIPITLGYSLTIWTAYKNDIKQILEQIAQKFSPVAYIRLQGVTDFESIVKLESVSSNENREVEPGSKRLIKYQVGMSVQTFIPQPIVRKKAVLKTKIDIVDGLSEEEITYVINRLEEAVGELKDV